VKRQPPILLVAQILRAYAAQGELQETGYVCGCVQGAPASGHSYLKKIFLDMCASPRA
jgi:hypothetical protein